jgi:hypothetical protein
LFNSCCLWSECKHGHGSRCNKQKTWYSEIMVLIKDFLNPRLPHHSMQKPNRAAYCTKRSRSKELLVYQWKWCYYKKCWSHQEYVSLRLQKKEPG